MSADIAAIAKAWMAHQGYTDEEIAEAEIATHESSGCERDGVDWICSDEYDNSNHPAWDVLEEATEMARVAVDALSETHAIIELPKQVDGWWPGGNSEIHIDGSDIVQVTCGQSVYRSVNMTRALAAGLLAAVAAADTSEVAS